MDIENGNRLAVSRPENGMVEIISAETDTRLSLPVQDVRLLIHALSHLDQIGSARETIFLDPTS